MKKHCFLISLYRKDEWDNPTRLVFLECPTYEALLSRLSNRDRVLLAIDSKSIEFELSLFPDCEGISLPLFQNNPTGKERNQDDFNHTANMIGRLTVESLRLY